MANYEAIRPAAGAVATIPSSIKRTMLVAVGGTVLISSDAAFVAEKAIPLRHGQALEMPANATWICQRARPSISVEIRRQDVE